MSRLRRIAFWTSLLWTVAVMAQERNIAVTPMLVDNVDIPERLCPVMEQKLLQIATGNGYGSRSQEFVLTANAVTIDKTAVPTVPPQVTLSVDVVLYVVNAAEQLIVDEYTVSLSGIGRNETAAYSAALKQLKPRSPGIRRFMSTVREKIVEYYAERVPVLIAKADSYAGRGEYDKAIDVLSAIPEAVAEYPDIAARMSNYYVQSVDREADRAIQAAKSEMAMGRIESALAMLNSIDPLSTRFGEASIMIESMLQPMKEEEKATYSKEVAVHNQQKEVAQQVEKSEQVREEMALTASYERSEERAVEDSVALKNRITEFLSKQQ